MDNETLFTLIWAPICIILASIGGYVIYKRSKEYEEFKKQYEKDKQVRKDKK